MAEAARRLLLAGVTARAFAASAVRAGWDVTAIDAFGDLDLRSSARVIPVRGEDGGFDPALAAAAARIVQTSAAAYTSNFENHPSAVAALASGRLLLGNAPAVLRRVRDPFMLMPALRRCGFRTPLTRASAPRADGPGLRRWLLKPRRSGGGHATSAWRPGVAVGRHQYLQQRVSGPVASITFLADGRGALAIGLSRQIVGRHEFGASGFRYCGSLVGEGVLDFDDGLLARAGAMAQAAAREFGLVGLNGIDFIARAGEPWPIEVNPRYSASMELLEPRAGPSLFELHADACGGRLPAAPHSPRRGVFGKAVVFARRSVTPGETRAWLRDPAIADIPHPGERIRRGRPICTVFAEGRSADACLRRLVAKAASIYRAVEPRARGAA